MSTTTTANRQAARVVLVNELWTQARLTLEDIDLDAYAALMVAADVDAIEDDAELDAAVRNAVETWLEDGLPYLEGEINAFWGTHVDAVCYFCGETMAANTLHMQCAIDAG